MFIATGAPIVGGFFPDLAVACGAAAGLWLFAGRTYLQNQRTRLVDQAAAVQESFDTGVFGMPEVRGREHMPSLEDIAKTYSKSEVKHRARLEKLRDWYPFEAKATPTTAVAICQRANVSYSDALLRSTNKVWRASLIVWVVAAAALCIWREVSAEEVLLIVALPVLPAFLDWLDFSRSYDAASHVRRTTAAEIEEAISSQPPIDTSRLLVWQERIYELRRSTPLVPDTIYYLARRANERAVKSAAAQLAKKPKLGAMPL